MSTTKPEVVFVNSLAAWGFMNGVINVAFSTYQFMPELQAGRDGDDTAKFVVVPSEVITANLRFDLVVAQQLRDALDKLIEANTKPKVMDS
jgi:hypothetical protein